MYKKEIDRLHKNGVYSDEMYEAIMSSMKESDDGQMIGFVPGKASLIYNLKFNPDNYNLVDLVVHSTPWLGADNDYPELFGKYGYTFCGIGDGFRWYRVDPNTEFTYYQQAIHDKALEIGKLPIDYATETELWKMLALSNTYWLNNYKEWLDKEEKKNYELRMKLDGNQSRI